VRGEVSVEPYSEVEGRFAPGAEVLARRRDLGVEPELAPVMADDEAEWEDEDYGDFDE
jgi:hypothetical protein